MLVIVAPCDRDARQSVTAPPRPPRLRVSLARTTCHARRVEALVEALIEEARQRARRRRRRYAASILLVALAAGGVYFGFDHAGGGAIASQPDTAGSSGVASPPPAPPVDDGGHPMDPTVAPSALSPSRPAPQKSSTRAPGAVSSRAGTVDELDKRRPRYSKRSDDLCGPSITSLAVDPRAPATVYAARSVWIDGGSTLREGLFKSTNGGRSWRALDLEARLVAISPAGPTTVTKLQAPLWLTKKQNRLFRSTNGAAAGRQPTAAFPRHISGRSRSTRPRLRRSTRRRGGVSSRAPTAATAGSEGRMRCRGKRCPRSRSTRETRRPCTPARTEV